MTQENANLLGAVTAAVIYIDCILVFVLRLLHQPLAGQRVGIVLFLAAIPLLILLITARAYQRPALYYIQISLMLIFILVELLLDYLLKINFRQTRWMVISYVVLFFAATGGMLGVANLKGRAWITVTGILYLLMAALAFIQRYKTGM